MKLGENSVTFPRVLGEKRFVEPVSDRRVGRRSTVFSFVQELMQCREIMRLRRFGTTPADDSRLTKTLSRVLVALLVQRAADVAAAFCAFRYTDFEKIKKSSNASIDNKCSPTCTPEQTVFVQTVKPLGARVTSSRSGRRFANALAGFGVANAHAAEYAGRETIAFCGKHEEIIQLDAANRFSPVPWQPSGFVGCRFQ